MPLPPAGAPAPALHWLTACLLPGLLCLLQERVIKQASNSTSYSWCTCSEEICELQLGGRVRHARTPRCCTECPAARPTHQLKPPASPLPHTCSRPPARPPACLPACLFGEAVDPIHRLLCTLAACRWRGIKMALGTAATCRRGKMRGRCSTSTPAWSSSSWAGQLGSFQFVVSRCVRKSYQCHYAGRTARRVSVLVPQSAAVQAAVRLRACAVAWGRVLSAWTK